MRTFGVAQNQIISIRMQYTFPLAGVLAATAAGLLFGVLAALVPMRRAARMQIIAALRYE